MSKGTPWTLNFPFDKSKYFSNLSPWRTLNFEATGSLGGAMIEEFQRKTEKTEEDKNREPFEENSKNTKPRENFGFNVEDKEP